MQKKRLYTIIECLILAGFVIFIIFILKSGSSAQIDISQIKTQMLLQEGTADLSQKDDQGVNAVFGLIPSEYLYLKSEEIMDVRELLIVRTKDDGEMQALENAVDAHLKTQISNFTGYGTNQLELLEQAVSYSKGDYYFFAVGENKEIWEAAFLKIIG